MERVDNHLFSTTERLLQLQEAQAGDEIVLDHHAPLDERQKWAPSARWRSIWPAIWRRRPPPAA
jgi:hypothetical protein